MPPRSVVTTEVEPDYFQFYARRANAEWASDKTTEAGYEAHLWSNSGFVTIGTARKFGTTAVAVEVWDMRPDEPGERWQHVAEVSLEPGDSLEILSWGDETPAIVVPIDEGWARLRVLWRGLVAGRFEGLNEGGSSDEHLTFQVWGAPPSPPTVVRWWSEWVLPPPSDVSPDGRRQVEGLEPVLERLSRLRTLDRVAFPYPAMPGGGENSRVHAVLFDPESETWWVDGSDIRRTLREITQEEAQDLMSRDPAP